jgi:outer membrane protein assembly factor BamD
VIKQYEDAKEAIPADLLPENQTDEPQKNEDDDGTPKSRSIFSYMTFGLFD